MTANRLSLYNGALRLMGERGLASLTESREPRRLLDDVWNSGNGAIRFVLEQGQWNFAIRTIQIDYDTTIDPDFGFRRGFSKPTDWVRTVSLASDEYLTNPLSAQQCVDERGYWFCDLDKLYVRYVSDHASYGSDLSLWPESVTLFAHAYLASQIAPAFKASHAADMRKLAKDFLRDAKNKDAMNEGTSYPRPGSWVRARMGGSIRERSDGTIPS